MIKHNRENSRYVLLTFILLIGSISLTGCWSSKEPNNLAVLNVMGVDLNETGQFELTALIVKPQSPFLQSSGSSGKNQELIEMGKGRSLLEAMSQLSTSISKQIYLGHVQVVIFGEKAASESMKESLDFLRRENDFRPNMKLLITKGKASDIISTPTQLKTPLGSEILNSIRTKKLSMTNMVLNLSQFTEALTMKMNDPITGEISLAQEKGIQVEQEVSGTNQDTKKSETDKKQNSNGFSIQGTAVFRRAHLMGWLNKMETRGVLWINGKLENDVLVLNCPSKESGTISLKIKRTTSQLSPQLVNGKPKMNVNIKVDGDIGQITCQNVNLSSDELEEMNRQLKGTIMQEVTQTFAKVKQDWQADIFNFGESIYRKYPKEWKEISPNWRSGGLKEMPVNLKVITNISRYGLRER
ncbi:Ger(x)C family spore germination protein [Neobacillus cucumis]|uniref:Ger(x)C family spore germination protein n=1 Tax=Neobacillus cucumis TaxID=1740721 RepID=UPI002852F9EA|nr:Ger(x)C family spore germination protein [Neobacillus cucumis]MDR4949806.1 Ger(x)C family spore germination protein [Neobacillus cucumis]